jgi:hypothetical protein
MRVIAGLIALAGLAGLVGLIAPLDEWGSLLPLLLEGELIKGILLLAGFALGLGLGGFAMAKERMSKLHAIATLIGFAAAGAVIEIWEWIKVLTQGANRRRPPRRRRVDRRDDQGPRGGLTAGPTPRTRLRRRRPRTRGSRRDR